MLKPKRKQPNYKFLFENAISAICLTNSNGDIIDCNDVFLQISGYQDNEESLIGNISSYLTMPEGEVFDFKSIVPNAINQTYLNFTSQKGNKIHCFVSIKQIELENNKHLLINVVDTKQQGQNKKKTPHNIDQKDYEIERLKKKLFLSEEKFNKLLELADSAVYIQNESKIMYVNQAWENLTGYSKEEIDNQLPCFIIHQDFKKLAQNRFISKLKNKKVPEKYDLKIRTKSGKDVWVNTKVSIVDYEDEKALLTTFVDISERMRTQQAFKESKKKFQSLFYENNSIMFVVDPNNGNIVDANEAACKFYGYSKAKMTTLNIVDISALSEEEIQSQIDAAMNGRREHYFFKHRLSNNEIRDVEIYSGKVEVKETILLYSVVHDVTARKKAEEALKESEYKLKQLNDQKDRFFSIIAHDLRGPIGSFMQLTEYIKENHDKINDADFKKYFNYIYASAKGTFKLLENLLMWTRSQLGVLEIMPEKINILELTEEALGIFAESARLKEIDFENLVDNNVVAFADKNTISTVIRNLIGNAIKFTPKNGDISINAKLADNEDNKRVLIYVKDSGLGIPDEKIDKLFRIEENYTTYGTENEKGTGLGLILCKELVDKNNGTIWVESEIGKGTVFTFSLPAVELN